MQWLINHDASSAVIGLIVRIVHRLLLLELHYFVGVKVKAFYAKHSVPIILLLSA